jgi:hypothetical protein
VGNRAHLKQEGELRNGKSRARAGISRKGNLCTPRRSGGFSRASKRSEATFSYPLISVPVVVASEIDVFPAKRRDVLVDAVWSEPLSG